MSRVSLRLRLTLVFAAAMATVLAAVGVFVYLRVGGALLTSVDQSLRAGASETVNHMQRADLTHDADFSLVDPDNARGETLAQLLDVNGRIVRSTPAGLAPLVGRSTVARVEGGTRILQTTGLTGRKSEWRLLARPVTAGGRRLVLVEASSLSSRQETLDRLLFELAVAGPVALLLASLAGYALAAAALRHVESMRRQAAAITAATPGVRLPVPPSRDELSRLAETLNAMLGRLEASLEHERRFVADASHELRTPLALLRTELELALRRPRSREELESALRSAAEETERLTSLAEDLLLIARSDGAGLPLRLETIDVGSVLEGVAARYADRAAAAGRELRTAEDASLAVLADPARVDQALGNLVENALRHGKGTIDLFPRGRADVVELHVTDEGPGFPPGFAPRAFDRFSRADEARGRSGTGLGLAIVDLIAKAHGGGAQAGQRPDGGADVWIVLERAQAPAPVPDRASDVPEAVQSRS
jgi:heavy metal sensor kinase